MTSVNINPLEGCVYDLYGFVTCAILFSEFGINSKVWAEMADDLKSEKGDVIRVIRTLVVERPPPKPPDDSLVVAQSVGCSCLRPSKFYNVNRFCVDDLKLNYLRSRVSRIGSRFKCKLRL